MSWQVDFFLYGVISFKKKKEHSEKIRKMQILVRRSHVNTFSYRTLLAKSTHADKKQVQNHILDVTIIEMFAIWEWGVEKVCIKQS